MEESVVSPEHPVYKMITGIVKRLVDANQDIEFFRKQTWTVVVVDSPESNAFVLPVSKTFLMMTQLSAFC